MCKVLLQARKKLDLCKIVSDNVDSWSTLWNSFQCGHIVFKLSRKAALANKLPLDQYVRDEYSLSTKALLLLHIEWATTKRKEDERERAQAMCTAWLSKIASSTILDPQVFRSRFGTFAHLCRPHVRGCCMHVNTCDDMLNEDSVNGPWSDFVGHLCRLRSLSEMCPAVKGILVQALDKICTHIDKRLDEVDMNRDVTKAELLEQDGKRLRIDEDFKHRVVVADVVNKRCHSGAQSLRVHGVGGISGSGLSADWEQQGLRCYRSAGWITFDIGGVFTVASDGKRLGMPCEDTECYLGWSGRADVGMYMAPMVHFETCWVNGFQVSPIVKVLCETELLNKNVYMLEFRCWI